MSLHTPDSLQHQTIELKQPTDGCRSPIAQGRNSELSRPDLVGLQFESIRVVSPVIQLQGKPGNRKVMVDCECQGCGNRTFILLTNLRGGRTKGCRRCNQPVQFPKWLYARAQQMRQRCTNQKNSRYRDYGGRGIEFRFTSAMEAALWIRDNLGVPGDRSLQIDRVNNEGHYEPGNLRWVTPPQNLANNRRTKRTPLMHRFKLDYPHVKYADGTLAHLFAQGLTPGQIAERWGTPSYKPKGKYGICSIADPVIASLLKTS